MTLSCVVIMTSAWLCMWCVAGRRRSASFERSTRVGGLRSRCAAVLRTASTNWSRQCSCEISPLSSNFTRKASTLQMRSHKWWGCQPIRTLEEATKSANCLLCFVVVVRTTMSRRCIFPSNSTTTNPWSSSPTSCSKTPTGFFILSQQQLSYFLIFFANLLSLSLSMS